MPKKPAIVNLPSRYQRNTGYEAHRSKRFQPTSMTAPDAKNEFATALESALRGQPVIITKHDDPKAVLISFDEFQALSETPETKLGVLSAEFDALLDSMQTREAENAMKRAFEASPEELGRVARRAARRRA